MLFGPLPVMYAEKLQELVQAAGGQCTFLSSMEDIREYQKQKQAEGARRIMSFDGLQDFLYIDIPKEYFLVVKNELERMGIDTGSEHPKFDDTTEYSCPVCDFTSVTKGLCPKGHGRLLEFTEWKRAKEERVSKPSQMFLIIAAILIILMVAFNAFKIFSHSSLFGN